MDESLKKRFDDFHQSVLTGLKELEQQFPKMSAEQQMAALRFVCNVDTEVWGYLPE